jgi:hypothetical protein
MVGTSGSGSSTIASAVMGEGAISLDYNNTPVEETFYITNGMFHLGGQVYSLKLINAHGLGRRVNNESNLAEIFAKSGLEIPRLHKIIVVLTSSRLGEVDFGVIKLLEANLTKHVKQLVHFVVTKCPPYEENRIKEQLCRQATQFDDIRNRISCVNLVSVRGHEDDNGRISQLLQREWQGVSDELRDIVVKADQTVPIGDAFIPLPQIPSTISHTKLVTRKNIAISASLVGMVLVYFLF